MRRLRGKRREEMEAAFDRQLEKMRQEEAAKDVSDEPTTQVRHVCGHASVIVERCAEAYRKRYCNDCARKLLPLPSESLQRFIAEKGDHFGPMLGPIGAVIYARQSWFGASGMLAWSGTDDMHETLEGFEPTRAVQPYVELFQKAGL